MNNNESFHYPPELFNLLVDTIPLPVRAKRDTLLFFRGAGVTEPVLAEMRMRLQQAPAEVTKYEIARTILFRLNENHPYCVLTLTDMLVSLDQG